MTEPLKQMIEFAEWVHSIEDAVSTRIRKCHPRSWNEDHITYSWLEELRSKSKYISLNSLPKPIAIAWDAFKADGALEESHGDVAILVKMTLPNRNELLGVAFLEAKRSYEKSGAFDKIDWKQLNRHVGNSSTHRLLLYDHQEIPCTPEHFWPLQLPFLYPHPDIYYLYRRFYRHFHRRFEMSTRASVLPTPHALAFRKRTRALHELSVPLSHQLCCRYLLGHDLDYDAKLVSDVQNGVAEGVDYLIVGHVAVGEGAEASTQSIPYNRESYRAPEQDRDTNE